MPDNNSDIKTLIGLLKKAVSDACEEEGLIKGREGSHRKGMEQSIVFRVGIHLATTLKESNFSNLNLDCEYNKFGNDHKKTTNRFPKGIRPDLLIHSRGCQEHNKLAVEFKGWWNRSYKNDIKKLQDLTSSCDNFRYLIGIFVLLAKDGPKYRYFRHGVECEEGECLQD